MVTWKQNSFCFEQTCCWRRTGGVFQMLDKVLTQTEALERTGLIASEHHRYYSSNQYRSHHDPEDHNS